MAGTENAFLLLGAILVLAGIAGTVLPAIPGVPLVFVGLLVAAWAEGFQKVGWITLTILGVLTLFSFGLDFLASSVGAKRVGASWLALVLSAVGAIAGLFFSLPGLILGPFLGAFLGEYLAKRDWRQARRVGFGTWLGMVLAIAGKLALIFTMVGIFLMAYVL